MAGHHRVWQRTVERRDAGDYPLDPGDLGGDHAHVGRCYHRVTAARHVAAHAVHGDVPVPEHDPRQGLHLHVLQRRFLDLGEPAYLRLGELDVVNGLCRHRPDTGRNSIVGQPEALRRPVVELLRHFPHGRIAPGLDVRENVLHGTLDALVLFRRSLRIDAVLDDLDHFSCSFTFSFRGLALPRQTRSRYPRRATPSNVLGGRAALNLGNVPHRRQDSRRIVIAAEQPPLQRVTARPLVLHSRSESLAAPTGFVVADACEPDPRRFRSGDDKANSLFARSM